MRPLPASSSTVLHTDRASVQCARNSSKCRRRGGEKEEPHEKCLSSSPDVPHTKVEEEEKGKVSSVALGGGAAPMTFRYG